MNGPAGRRELSRAERYEAVGTTAAGSPGGPIARPRSGSAWRLGGEIVTELGEPRSGFLRDC